MCHDQRTHKTSRNTPRGGPYIFRLILFVHKGYVESLSEILTQEVGCAALKCLAILHHCLDGVGLKCTGETFSGTLDTADHGNCHEILGEIAIYMKHTDSLLFSLLTCGVSSVTLLPEELGGAEEHACTHLPTEHVRPLVDQDGKITI